MQMPSSGRRQVDEKLLLQNWHFIACLSCTCLMEKP